MGRGLVAEVSRVRSRISRGEITPASFRALLANVPLSERDAWLDHLCGLDGIPDDEPELPRGCVPYLPCPVAALLEMIEGADVRADDVFVDIGCGLGRAATFTHLVTGAACVGIEIQSGLVRGARRLIARLGLDRVAVVEGDAAEQAALITMGTVFFFYCPFSGARLARVLDDLEPIARTRPIRICCVDLPLPSCEWLIPLPTASPELTVYRSAASPSGLAITTV